MASLTRTAAKTRARYLLAEPTARFYTEANLNDWCNDAVSDISLRTYCYQIVATAIDTVNGTYQYGFPTTFNTSAINTIGVKTVLNSSGVSLAFITPDMLGKTTENPSEMHWSEWGRNVLISPTPTAAYSLKFLCWVEAEQAAAGALNLPQPYQHLVPYYMAYKGFEAKRNIDSAAKLLEQYENGLNMVMQTIHAKDNPILGVSKPGLSSQSVGS